MTALDIADNFAEGVADALDGHPWSTRLARYVGYAEGFDYATAHQADAIEDRDADDYTAAMESYDLDRISQEVAA